MDELMETLSLNAFHLGMRAAEAAARGGWDADEVKLLPVTKSLGPETVVAASAAGFNEFGENRVQEAAEKIPCVAETGLSPTWHLVGHLQTNKVRAALRLFEVIQSVDSLRLAEAIDRIAGELSRVVRVLLQANTSGEPTKHGFEPPELYDVFDEIVLLPRLRVEGLMTIGPPTSDTDVSRAAFRRLRELRDQLQDRHPKANLFTLSMGMSDDYEVASEEGGNLLRIGRALLGPRGQRPF